MLRTALGSTALLVVSVPAALAGALDRSGQPVTPLFEPGNYLELSFGHVMPSVEGTHSSPFGTSRSGGIAEDFWQGSVAAKFDASDQLSFAIIYDQPFRADVDYGDADPTYPIAGSQARFESTGITALGRYRFNENVSVHAGARMVQTDADLFVRSIATVTAGGPVFATYDASFEPDRAVGFVVGAAYERPEIALRVALTYSSELSFENDYSYTLSSPLGTVPGTGTTRYTMPQSVNLDFRTGIAPNTLLFGSIRWADWSETVIELENYLTGEPVVDYPDDYITYTIGVGRRFTEQFAGSASIIYEPGITSDYDPATGEGGVSNLAPADGQVGLQLTGTYYVNDAIELTGALRYIRFDDTTTERVGAVFEDKDALTLGLRVGYRF